MTTTHIRPKVRSRKGAVGNESLDVLIEQTRQKLKLFSTSTTNAATGHVNNDELERIQPAPIEIPSHENHSSILTNSVEISNDTSSGKPKGILKTSKKFISTSSTSVSKPIHSINPLKVTETTKKDQVNEYFHKFENESLASELGLNSYHELMDSNRHNDDQDSTVKPFLKDLIVERKVEMNLPKTNDAKMENFNHNAIEGHDTTSKTYHQSAVESNDDMKIIGSLSELVAYAQETSKLNEEKDSSPTSIETELDFSCFTKEQYDQISDSAKALGMSVEEYLEHQDMFEDHEEQEIEDEDELKDGLHIEKQENDDEDVPVSKNKEEHDDDEDDFVDLLGSVLDEEYLPSPPLRPFMMIWNALSTWITPDAVLVLRTFKADMFENHDRLVSDESADSMKDKIEPSDVASSRAAGLMSMLKMNLTKALTELGYTNDGYTKRLAETRLSEFLRCFDYSQPMVKFHSDLWRALTIVILDIVLPKYDIAYEGQSGIRVSPSQSLDDNAPLFAFMNGIGISKDEYKYLVSKAIPSLDLGAL